MSFKDYFKNIQWVKCWVDLLWYLAFSCRSHHVKEHDSFWTIYNIIIMKKKRQKLVSIRFSQSWIPSMIREKLDSWKQCGHALCLGQMLNITWDELNCNFSQSLNLDGPVCFRWIECVDWSKFSFQGWIQFSQTYHEFNFRVRTGPGKPGKSWNFVMAFSRTGKSWKKATGPGKSWKSV